MQIGMSATLERTVTAADTAEALGSGDLPVLGTPRLLAWCEAATCRAVQREMDAARTTVGTRVDIEHVAASPVGAVLVVAATLEYAETRLLRFDVVARHVADDKVVAHGKVTRVVVDRDRFLSRLS